MIHDKFQKFDALCSSICNSFKYGTLAEFCFHNALRLEEVRVQKMDKLSQLCQVRFCFEVSPGGFPIWKSFKEKLL